MKKKSQKTPDKCKNCEGFWAYGIKDGKHDRWCCRLGQPAFKAVGHCNVMGLYRPIEKASKG